MLVGEDACGGAEEGFADIVAALRTSEARSGFGGSSDGILEEKLTSKIYA